MCRQLLMLWLEKEVRKNDILNSGRHVKVKVKVKSLSRLWLFETPRPVTYQASQSMGFSRQEYWSGLPFPSPGGLPDPGIEPRFPTLQADSLPNELWGKPPVAREINRAIFFFLLNIGLNEPYNLLSEHLSLLSINNFKIKIIWRNV